MKTTMQKWDEWLRRRFRMYIWKQWKKPKTRVKNLMKLGMPHWQACRNGNSSKGYWAVAGSGILTHTITNEGLALAGYSSILSQYEFMHLCALTAVVFQQAAAGQRISVTVRTSPSPEQVKATSSPALRKGSFSDREMEAT